MDKLFENPLIVRMVQTVVFQTMMDKVNEEKDYLNDCSVDEFVKITEMIRDDTEYNHKIIKDIIYNMIYREDLKPVANLVLCNLAYYLDKFDEIDYKHQEYMIQFLTKDYKLEIGRFDKYLLKYILILIKKNIEKFYTGSKCEMLDL